MRRAAVAETTWAPSARSRVRPWVILVLVCGVQFMVILDLAVVNVALPSIQKDLGLDQADLQWVVITYGLMLGGFLLLGGRAADLLGRRRVLLAGLALFTISSFTAGLAGSLGQLVVSRAGQGLGGALDPGQHVRRGPGAHQGVGRLRRRRRQRRLGGGDRQRPAHHRAGMGMDLLG